MNPGNEDLIDLLESNWQCGTANKSLRDTITITNAQGKNNETDLEFVTMDSCVLLQQLDSNNSPVITIKSNSNATIGIVDVASEANVIEVYDNIEGYLTTVKCELFDDFEGITVYNGHVVLPRHVQNVTLKFPCFKPTTMWLFGIGLSIQKKPSPRQPKQPPVPPSATPLATALMDMIQRGDNQQKNGFDLNKMIRRLSCEDKSDTSLDEMKRYVDEKVDTAEKNIISAINERFSALEQKQERNFSYLCSLIGKESKVSSDS